MSAAIGDIAIALQPKLCKDCKFAIPDKDFANFRWFYLFPIIGWVFWAATLSMRIGPWRFARCAYERKPSLLDGKFRDDADLTFCSTARLFRCGSDAKWFEARK